MPDVNPARLMRAIVEAQKLLESLPEDERLRRDAIEGETQLFELLDRYAEEVVRDREFLRVARERLHRIEMRKDRSSIVVMRVLDALGMTGLERPLYPASISRKDETVITDPELLPADCRRPDKQAIGAKLARG